MKYAHGRFAPSPTGPLHAGSVLAAVASFLQARSRGGRWYVRIEDVDEPRTVAGAAETILRQLQQLGMIWDAEPVYQSKRKHLYQQALLKLQQQHWVYACDCPRNRVNGTVYDGRCRRAPAIKGKPAGLRVKCDVQENRISFHDQVQGKITESLSQSCGDFIIKRKDGLFAYQLAVVVDDAEQGVGEVVRGNDLLDSTARQIYLQRLLQLPTPAYLHIPLITDAHGNKLSKQNYAPPVDSSNPLPVLFDSLQRLGQKPPPSLRHENLSRIWEWAQANWKPARIPVVPPAVETV